MTFFILHSSFFILFTLLSWRRLPYAVLLTIVALPSYLIRFHIASIPMTLLEGMLLIVFAVWVIQKIKNLEFRIKNVEGSKKFFILHSSFFIPIMLFLITGTISMIAAPDLRAAAGIWKAYFVEPILFFVVLIDLLKKDSVILNAAQRSEESRASVGLSHIWAGSFASLRMTPKNIITALSLTALLLSLYAMYQRFTGFGIPPPWNRELRVTSIFPYPNALGLYLAPLIPLFFSMLFRVIKQSNAVIYDRKHMRCSAQCIYWIVVIVTSIMAIFFAHSTGALVGVVAGLFVMVFLYLSSRGASRASDAAIPHRGTRLSRPVAMGLAMTVAVVVLAFLAPTSIKNELLLRDWSGHVHTTQWQETWHMLKDRPILGAGLAGYKTAFKPYHKATYIEIFEYPHDIVLNFWSETGLLGLLAFAWLMVAFFRKTFVIRHSSFVILGAMGAITTLLVHGLVDVPYFKNDLAVLFWIIYALGVTSINEYAPVNKNP